jgi:hypothetical protein
MLDVDPDGESALAAGAAQPSPLPDRHELDRRHGPDLLAGGDVDHDAGV